MSLNVELLESSFEKVKPNVDEFGKAFYQILFETAPAAKPLFAHTDLGKQQKMLTSSLALVVENLRNPEVLTSTLKGLGARHVKYGALPEHYPIVGGALLQTFEKFLGDEWTADVKQAWVDAYGAITTIMLDGADYSASEVELKSEATAATTPEVSDGDRGGMIPIAATLGGFVVLGLILILL